ncbi:hypothetical protein FQR65_LT11967 [Abscondita terminalis]|nr:hypothetical protein FQR65_LT11967 [Abscondita terminalis]
MKIYSANGGFRQDKTGFISDLTVSDGNLIIQTTEKIRMSKDKFKFTGHLTNNKYPELNLHVNYDGTRTRSRLRNLLEAVHGSDPDSMIRRLIIRNDAYFDVNDRIFKLEDEIKYPHGEIFVSSNFERSDTSFSFDGKFKMGSNVYGGNIVSNYERSFLGETRMIIYGGDRKIETTLVHSLEKLHPAIGFYINRLEFTFKSPQTDIIYVNVIFGDTPPKMNYAFQIKDTSRKYVDLDISRVSSKYNLVMYITDKWDITARVDNEGTVTKGDLVANVFGDNGKYEVFANITPSSYKVGSSMPDNFYIRNSLIINGKSYGNVNVSYWKHTDHKKLISTHRFNLNTSDIIRSGVRDDLQIDTDTHSAMTNGAKSEIAAVYTGYCGEYNFKLTASEEYLKPSHDVILKLVRDETLSEERSEGINVEITRYISDSEMWNFKIDALNHEEQLLVGVGYDRRGGVNVTSEVRSNLILDSLKANFSTVISLRRRIEIFVKAWAMTKHCEHKLNGEFKENERGGELLASLTNNYSPPITLTTKYDFKHKNLEIMWDLRRGTSTLSTALITIGENRRRDYVVSVQGTHDEHTFAANLILNLYKFDNALEISVDDENVIVGRVAVDTYFNMLLVELRHRNSEHVLLQLDSIDTGKLKIRLGFVSFNSESAWSVEDLHKFNIYFIIENVIKLSLDNAELRLPHHTTDHIKYEVSISNANLISGSTKMTVSDKGTYNLTSKILLHNTTHVLQTTFLQERDTLGLIQKYCGEKGPCLEIDALHAVNKNSLLLDLRIFGWRKMYVEQTSLSNNHTVEVVFDDRTKYAARVLEVRNGIECSLSMPRRLTVLDLRYNSSSTVVTMNYDFYPNKLQSPHKTTLTVACKMSPKENKCETILSDPNLSRNLMIGATIKDDNNGNQLLIYVFDIFQRGQDKIVLEVRRTQDTHAYSESRKVMSTGLDFSCEYVTKVKLQKQIEDGFEYVYGAQIQLGNKTYVNGLVTRVFPNEMLFNLTAFNNQVFMLQARRIGSPLKTVVEGDLELIGVSPMYGRLTTRNFASLNFTSGFKNHLDKFEFGAKLFGGDFVRAQATKNNAVLFTTSLSMKGERLDFDYRYNASSVDNLVLKPGKRVLTESRLVFGKLLKNVPLSDDIRKVHQRLHTTVPDFTNYLNFYLKEKNTLKGELLSDPALRPLNSILADILETGYHYADVIANDTYKYIAVYLSDYLYRDFQMTLANARLSTILEDELFVQIVDFNYFLGAHEKDVREFGVDFFARVDESLAVLHAIKRSFLEAYRNFKDTAIWVKLSGRLDRGPPASPELIRRYKKIVAELRANTNSIETIRLLNLLEAYTEKKLLKKYVDDEAAIEEITEALEDVLLFIYNDDSSSWQTLMLLLKVSLVELHMGYERIGLVDLRLDEVRTTVAEEIEKLNFPQYFTGVFGQDHIFTFDENHVTMNTNCELLLLEDAIDGNFSITTDSSKGYPTFTFEDKKNRVKLFKNGWDFTRKFTETNAYPLSVSFNSNQILIKSKYGAQLDCDLLALNCVVKVSGYYHGHLKGLLGNANREAYDDFMMPNGKIASNSEKFVQSYATRQCSVLQTTTDAPSNPHCEQLFSELTFR